MKKDKFFQEPNLQSLQSLPWAVVQQLQCPELVQVHAAADGAVDRRVAGQIALFLLGASEGDLLAHGV